MTHEIVPEASIKDGLPWLRDISAHFLFDALKGGFFGQLDPKKREIIARYALTQFTFDELSRGMGVTPEALSWHAETGIYQMWDLMPDDLKEKYDPTTLLPIKSKGWHMTGRKLPQEVRDKMSKSRTGYKHSDETKEKLRQQQAGHSVSDDARRKMSEAAKKRKRGPLSEETKRRISEVKKEKNRNKKNADYMQDGVEIFLQEYSY